MHPRVFLSVLDSPGFRLNFHISSLIGLSSILWSAHLVTAALPAARGLDSYAYLTYVQGYISPLINACWFTYSVAPDSPYHIVGNTAGSGSSILTFIGGLDVTGALRIGDMAHHHLALGVLCIWSSNIYSSLYRVFGSRLSNLISVSGYLQGSSHIYSSLHLQLSLSLMSISIIVSLVSYLCYILPAYPYISYDYLTTVSLFVHHYWISSFAMVGSFVHASLFLIRDFSPSSSASCVVSRILAQKSALISHLSWVSLWLGFHTLGVYIHNDTVVSFGEAHKQILIEPVIAQAISSSSSHITSAYFATSLEYHSLFANLSTYSSLYPGDLLAYHSISLGLHVTTLILLKGALDSKGSRLMPDKGVMGFGFACDGPSRGGTCDISAWDAFYLSVFWLLNSNSWLLFYFHWKHLLVWHGSLLKFIESSTFLNGWFRDYLWFNSGSLISGYDSVGSNDLSVFSWLFLGAHLCWAVGFMFLISWRGYWQEIIESILYMHLKTPILYDLWDGRIYSPGALSIVQARFIGLVHFSVGLIATYAAFVLGSTS
jgi:photosystem I P700 chlorophyll a apoprotein A2